MKTRNKLIILVAIIGVVLFAVVQGIVIPNNNERSKQYIDNQKNPTTHDLNSILKYKNKYMGNFSNISNLFHALPLNNSLMSFELFSDKLTVQVNYKDTTESINENQINKALIYNSTAAFALIDNLEAINYNIMGLNYKVLRSDVEKWYGGDLTGLLKNDEWKRKVQDKLEDNEYVNDCTKVVLKKQ